MNMKFDFVGCFNDGFATVKLNNQYNFIDKKGNMLLNQWFDDAWSFHDGFAVVKLNNQWNFIG